MGTAKNGRTWKVEEMWEIHVYTKEAADPDKKDGLDFILPDQVNHEVLTAVRDILRSNIKTATRIDIRDVKAYEEL